ncbi:hypothetical protein L2218_20075, partial [Xanthomonas perforans]
DRRRQGAGSSERSDALEEIATRRGRCHGGRTCKKWRFFHRAARLDTTRIAGERDSFATATVINVS